MLEDRRRKPAVVQGQPDPGLHRGLRERSSPAPRGPAAASTRGLREWCAATSSTRAGREPTDPGQRVHRDHRLDPVHPAGQVERRAQRRRRGHRAAGDESAAPDRVGDPHPGDDLTRPTPGRGARGGRAARVDSPPGISTSAGTRSGAQAAPEHLGRRPAGESRTPGRAHLARRCRSSARTARRRAASHSSRYVTGASASTWTSWNSLPEAPARATSPRRQPARRDLHRPDERSAP